MPSYDITFCDFYKGCKLWKKCRRALTPERLKSIQRAWGKGDPILSHFAAKPECFEKDDK